MFALDNYDDATIAPHRPPRLGFAVDVVAWSNFRKMGNRISQIIIQLLGSRIAPTVVVLVVGPGRSRFRPMILPEAKLVLVLVRKAHA